LSQHLTALGVHIYAGGFTVGVSDHFEPLGHLEEGKIGYGAPSAKLNFPELPMISGVENWKPFVKDLMDRRGKPNLVYCNPPCAAFSVAGATMRGGGNAWRTDPRLSCWHNCFSVFEQVQPDFYVVESVVRAFTAGREFIDGFVQRAADEYGYSATHVLIDGQNHGIAQIRKRYFLVLHKKDFHPMAPNWGPAKTAREALAEVGDDKGWIETVTDPVQKKMIPALPQGKPLRPIWEQMMRETVGPEESWPRSSSGVKGRPRLFLHRVKPDSPIGTITGAYFIAPDEDRMLGTRELQHLNGFPLDYRFEGHPRGWPSLIARGVSPKVASYLADNIARSIRTGKNELANPEMKIVDYRSPPEEVVPKRARKTQTETLTNF
jgi:site-specific DNA-cytosine methylase